MTDLNRMRKLAGILVESSTLSEKYDDNDGDYSMRQGEQGNPDRMRESAPPGMEDTVLDLKKQYPGEEEKAFATAWSIYNKKHGKTDEAIEVGDSTLGEPGWYIVNGLGAVNAGPYESEQAARSDTDRMRWFNQTDSILYGIEDEEGNFMDAETGDTHSMQTPMAEDLNNGYKTTRNIASDDYFPNGADGSVTTKTGPSGARHGDNPEQKAIAVKETHKELVYSYRKYLKESASSAKNAHQQNLDAAQKEIDKRSTEGEDMSGYKVDQKTYKVVKTGQGKLKESTQIADVNVVEYWDSPSSDGRTVVYDSAIQASATLIGNDGRPHSVVYSLDVAALATVDWEHDTELQYRDGRDVEADVYNPVIDDTTFSKLTFDQQGWFSIDDHDTEITFQEFHAAFSTQLKSLLSPNLYIRDFTALFEKFAEEGNIPEPGPEDY